MGHDHDCPGEGDGGDGDPLDVFVLGPAIDRGSVVAVHLVAIIRATDGGERDDKLIAVPFDGPFAGIQRLSDLESEFPGVIDILTLWLENYKGPGELIVESVGAGLEAREALALGLLRP